MNKTGYSVTETLVEDETTSSDKAVEKNTVSSEVSKKVAEENKVRNYIKDLALSLKEIKEKNFYLSDNNYRKTQQAKANYNKLLSILSDEVSHSGNQEEEKLKIFLWYYPKALEELNKYVGFKDIISKVSDQVNAEQEIKKTLSPEIISGVDNLTYECQQYIINKDPKLFKYIKNPLYIILKRAAIENKDNIKNIKNDLSDINFGLTFTSLTGEEINYLKHACQRFILCANRPMVALQGINANIKSNKSKEKNVYLTKDEAIVMVSNYKNMLWNLDKYNGFLNLSHKSKDDVFSKAIEAFPYDSAKYLFETGQASLKLQQQIAEENPQVVLDSDISNRFENVIKRYANEQYNRLQSFFDEEMIKKIKKDPFILKTQKNPTNKEKEAAQQTKDSIQTNPIPFVDALDDTYTDEMWNFVTTSFINYKQKSKDFIPRCDKLIARNQDDQDIKNQLIRKYPESFKAIDQKHITDKDIENLVDFGGKEGIKKYIMTKTDVILPEIQKKLLYYNGNINMDVLKLLRLRHDFDPSIVTSYEPKQKQVQNTEPDVDKNTTITPEVKQNEPDTSEVERKKNMLVSMFDSKIKPKYESYKDILSNVEKLKSEYDDSPTDEIFSEDKLKELLNQKLKDDPKANDIILSKLKNELLANKQKYYNIWNSKLIDYIIQCKECFDKKTNYKDQVVEFTNTFDSDFFDITDEQELDARTDFYLNFINSVIKQLNAFVGVILDLSENPWNIIDNVRKTFDDIIQKDQDKMDLEIVKSLS